MSGPLRVARAQRAMTKRVSYPEVAGCAQVDKFGSGKPRKRENK